MSSRRRHAATLGPTPGRASIGEIGSSGDGGVVMRETRCRSRRTAAHIVRPVARRSTNGSRGQLSFTDALRGLKSLQDSEGDDGSDETDGERLNLRVRSESDFTTEMLLTNLAD